MCSYLLDHTVFQNRHTLSRKFHEQMFRDCSLITKILEILNYKHLVLCVNYVDSPSLSRMYSWHRAVGEGITVMFVLNQKVFGMLLLTKFTWKQTRLSPGNKSRMIVFKLLLV